MSRIEDETISVIISISPMRFFSISPIPILFFFISLITSEKSELSRNFPDPGYVWLQVVLREISSNKTIQFNSLYCYAYKLPATGYLYR